MHEFDRQADTSVRLWDRHKDSFLLTRPPFIQCCSVKMCASRWRNWYWTLNQEVAASTSSHSFHFNNYVTTQYDLVFAKGQWCLQLKVNCEPGSGRPVPILWHVDLWTGMSTQLFLPFYTTSSANTSSTYTIHIHCKWLSTNARSLSYN